MKQFIHIAKILISFSSFLTLSACDQGGYKAADGDRDEVATVEPVDDVPVAVVDPVANTSLDILLVVDDSGSMLADNQKLASRLTSLTRDMGNEGIDWQMCVTTTDVYYYEGRAIIWRDNNDSHIVNSSSDLGNVFMNTITWIGHGWSDDEQGIRAMSMAINEPANRDCFRDGATLAIILISDEDERSVGGVESLNSFQYRELEEENSAFVFMDSAFAKFGATKEIAVHSVIVNNADCKYIQDGAGSVSFIGTKYRELSTLTRGSITSICDDDYLDGVSLYGQ